jgi:hypothetical protein
MISPPNLPKLPASFGVVKGDPVENVSMDALLELSIAVPTPANTSNALCALATVLPMQSASAGRQIERTSFDTINLINLENAACEFFVRLQSEAIERLLRSFTKYGTPNRAKEVSDEAEKRPCPKTL